MEHILRVLLYSIYLHIPASGPVQFTETSVQRGGDTHQSTPSRVLSGTVRTSPSHPGYSQVQYTQVHPIQGTPRYSTHQSTPSRVLQVQYTPVHPIQDTPRYSTHQSNLSRVLQVQYTPVQPIQGTPRYSTHQSNLSVVLPGRVHGTVGYNTHPWHFWRMWNFGAIVVSINSVYISE